MEVDNNQKANPDSVPSQALPNQSIVNNQRGNVPMIIGVVLILLIVGGGAYYLGTQRDQPPSPTTEQQYQKPIKTAFEGSFQDILIKNCERFELQKGVSFIDAIDISKAPVSINQNIINLNYLVPNKLVCAGFDDTKSPNNYLLIGLQDKSYINVYDKNSKELGHGGPPYIGSYGTVIRDDGNIKLTVYIVGSEGPSLIGHIPVVMRGEKRLKLSNGDTVYANYSKTAIEGNESRLVEFLNAYSKPSDYEPGSRELTSDPTEELKNKFFSNLSNLQPSEKSALSEIERVLSAITAK